MNFSYFNKNFIEKCNKEIQNLNEEERKLMKRLQEINKERAKKQIHIAELYLNRLEEN
ncbi:hypothetical protein [Wukongibacter sp. M2B1]|uniref:hypothetical protein n=1 Tax=Wukongibacter sp. M2B1 TaxID=3088895 RepID=UPI003D7BB994